MTENPNFDPQTRRNVGPGVTEDLTVAPPERPTPDTVSGGEPSVEPDVEPSIEPTVDPTVTPAPESPEEPLPERLQRENAATSLDQPSDGVG